MLRSHRERLKRIQEKLGVEADGVLGAETLTALESKLGLRAGYINVPTLEDSNGVDSLTAEQLTLTKSGIQKIIDFEIGSVAYYEAQLRKPTWPGGDSGVTIGIGYDLGYQTLQGFTSDWGNLLSARDIDKLSIACGKKKLAAKRLISRFSRVQIPYQSAYEVFIQNDSCGSK